MALTIFHSDNYSWLLQTLVATESKALQLNKNPFEFSSIWLASNADEWEIRRGFCDVTGIAANLDFSPIAEGLWSTCSHLLGGLGAKSPFSEDSLKPLIFDVLEEWARQPQTGAASNTWLPVEQSQRLSVAAKLAAYFARYVTYRQSMLNEWVQTGTSAISDIDSDQAWQRRLWLALAEKISLIGKPHPFSFLKSLPKNPAVRSRFHVFNPLALAPLYEQALWHLSRVHDVSVYFFNPSPLNWQDRNDALPRMLAALGQERRYAFERLSHWIEAGAQEETFYSEPVASQSKNAASGRLALPLLKDQLNSLETPTSAIHGTPEGTGLVRANDMVVLSCATIAEQFSEVRLSIENHLAQDASLGLHDILVLLPRDQGHQSYQRAAQLLPWLWYEGLVYKLPYRLSGIEIGMEDALAQAWLRLLDMVQGDFELDIVFDWLSLSAVSTRLALSTDEITRWKDWAVAAGIRRGIHSRQSDSHSWQAGIDWLLLSYAGQQTPNEPSSLMITGLELELLGKVMAEMAGLANLVADTRRRRNAQDWIALLTHAFEALVLFEGCDVAQEACLRELIASVSSLASADLDFETVKTWFLTDSNLLNAESDRTTLQRSPTLTVAPLGALRGQAFKVIYIVGAEKIPINIAGGNLDLMVKFPEIGDPSLREGDLCSVLDVLVAATGSVEFSYLGKDPVNQIVLAEPMLVSLLKASLAEFGFEPRSTRMASNQAVSARPKDDNPLDKNQLPVWLNGKRNLQVSESDVETVDEQMMRLMDLTDPLRHYLRRHIGLQLFDDDSTLDAAEPFELDYLDLWRRRKDQLNDPLSGLRRSVPQGKFGALSALKADLEMQEAQQLALIADQSNDPSQSAVTIEAAKLGWSLLIKALIRLASGDQKDVIVVARNEYLKISMSTPASERENLMLALIALREDFQARPFVFGQTAAFDYVKNFNKFNAMTGDIPLPEAKLWKGRDGQQPHDVLWAHQTVRAMPCDMVHWLERLGGALASAMIVVKVGPATELADWVVLPGYPAASGEQIDD
jgi:exonuclease V gamma subunit